MSAIAHAVAPTGRVEYRSLGSTGEQQASTEAGRPPATLQDQLEQRDRALSAARALDERARAEKRELTEAELAEFRAHESSVRQLNDTIKRQQFLDEQERTRPPAATRTGGRDGSFEQQCRAFSLCRAIAGRLDGADVDDGREREVSAELARRTGKAPQGILVPHETFAERRTLLTSNTGEHLYPDRHRDDLFIDRLRESLVATRLGATVLSGLKGTQDIPRMTDSTRAYWVDEHEDVTASDVAFDSVKLEPKTVGAETEYSRRMIINASPDVENLMRRDLADTLATAIDWAVVAGDGQENRPTGVLHAPGTQALPYTDGDDVPEHLLQLEEALELSNVRGGQLAFLMHPSAYRAIRALKDADGHPLLMKARDRLHDLPVLRSSHIPRDEAEETSPLILGSWSDLMIGYWSTVDILVNPYHSAVYSKGAVKINALQDVDVAVRHPESFVIAADFIS